MECARRGFKEGFKENKDVWLTGRRRLFQE